MITAFVGFVVVALTCPTADFVYVSDHVHILSIRTAGRVRDPQRRREFSVKCSRLKCVYLVLLMSLTAFISIENAHDIRGTSDSAEMLHWGGFYKETLEYAHNPQVDDRHARCLALM